MTRVPTCILHVLHYLHESVGDLLLALAQKNLHLLNLLLALSNLEDVEIK